MPNRKPKKDPNAKQLEALKKKVNEKSQTKGKSRKNITREAASRMRRINQFLKKQRQRDDGEMQWWTAPQLADILGVEEQTVRLDLVEMRDGMGLPLDYIPARRGWGYLEDVVEFPGIDLTKNEVTTLFVIELAMQILHGSTIFGKSARSVIPKILEACGETMGVDRETLQELVAFRTAPFEGPTIIEKGVLETVFRALVESEEIEFEHEKPNGEKTYRRGRPTLLLNYANAWYLLADDLNLPPEDCERTFMLCRARKVKRTGVNFVRKKINRKEVLKKAFGIYKGTLEAIHLRFSAKVARFICERQIEGGKKLVPSPDGSVDLFMEAPRTPELLAWVLKWGREVQVLGSQELYLQVREEVQALSEMYGLRNPDCGVREEGE